MTLSAPVVLALGIASAAGIALNVFRPTAAPPAAQSSPADSATARSSLPPDPNPVAIAEAQLQALRSKLQRSVGTAQPVSNGAPAPASATPASAPQILLSPQSAGTADDASRMPVIPYDQPEIWHQFEVNGLTFQINPADAKIASRD